MEKRRIYVKWGITGKIAEFFGVSQQTVRNALKGATDGDQPDLIREEAIKRGGFYAEVPEQQDDV